MAEDLMSSSLSGDYQGCAAGLIWLHVRGLLSSVTNRTSVGCEWRRARRYLPFNSISLSIGSEEREGSRLGAVLTSTHKPDSCPLQHGHFRSRIPVELSSDKCAGSHSPQYLLL